MSEVWHELKEWGGWVVAVFGTIGGHVVGNATALNKQVQALSQIIDKLTENQARLELEIEKLKEENIGLKTELEMMKK